MKNDFASQPGKDRVFIDDTGFFFYLDKMCHNIPLDHAAFNRNAKKPSLHSHFMKNLVAQYLVDDSVPHRNHDVKQLPHINQILDANIVTD